MSDNNDIAFCNCSECRFEGVCCSSDAWKISLTPQEAKRFPHAMNPNGQIVIASGSDGYCLFRDPETGKCKTYGDRPFVCKKFTCQGRDEEMTKLLKTHKEIRGNLNAKFSGHFVAFIHPTEKQVMCSSMMVKEVQNGKQIQLMPTQVFGDTEEEVKQKITDIINTKFKREDL